MSAAHLPRLSRGHRSPTPKRAPRTHSGQRRPAWWRLSAAAIVLAVGTAMLWFRGTAPEPTTQRRVANVTRPTTTPPTTAETVATVAPNAFDAALAELRARIDETTTPASVMAALQRIAATQPSLAIELADAVGRTTAEKDAWVTELTRDWTVREPQAAWEWLGQLDAKRLRDFASGTVPDVVIGTLATHAPELLVRALDALVRRGEADTGVAPVVAVHLAIDALAANAGVDTARAAVEAWARDPSKPSIGEAAYVSVAKALLGTSPERAATWLLSQPASTERDAALNEFPAQWVQTQPRAALDWIEQSVPPAQQMAARQRAFSEWVERDAAAAGEWLSGYLGRAPGSADGDRLIGDIVNLSPATQASPQLALQWTGLMSDPAARTATEERIALRWSRQDPNAAIEYVARSATLPVDRKQALLARIAQGSGGG